MAKHLRIGVHLMFYTIPGTYVIKLTLTDVSGDVSVHSGQVVIGANPHPTVYVSAAGNDAFDGSSDAKALKTFAAVQSRVTNKSNLQIRFRRGDTFDVAVGLTLRGSNINGWIFMAI